MSVKRKLGDVFKTVGLPPYTYIKPAHFGEVRSDVEQAGKHVLIEGPSGIGKSCVIFKIFEEIGWSDGVDYKYVSGRAAGVEKLINSFLKEAVSGAAVEPRTLVIDDFHILDESFRIKTGSDLKRISDRAFSESSPPKVILIGIPAAGASLLTNAQDLGPRLGTYRLSRASDHEIRRLIAEDEQELNVIFEDSDVILAESAGNFWLAQFICNKVCAVSDVHETCDSVNIVQSDLLNIRRRTMDDLANRFMPVARTFAKGKKWRPGGNKPYLEILLSLMKLPDLVVPFDKVLSVVPERRRPGIKAVRGRIREVIFDESKKVDLRKQLAFEDAGFSIEDPLFRYFLSNLNPNDIFRDLGVDPESMEVSSVYSYDVGFSFAGETRKIVELVNEELKAEDVETFYDYDLQAFLLADNLESTLARVYSEACKYYLVFLEESYLGKVWTNYERDIMTAGTRSKHIIPIFLQSPSSLKAVGIPGTTGMIDLSDVWRQVRAEGRVDDGTRATIRNRLVLPLLEKIDTVFQDV